MGKTKNKDADKPRGKMSAYAYFLQICREDHKKKYPNDQVNFAEFSKKCAEKWKGMNDKEKKRFHDLAATDKIRFEKDMASYSPPAGSKGVKRKRGKKDPNAPKRALSAFFWFCNDERPKVRAVNPGLGVGDVAKEMGKRWAVVTGENKARYEQLAAKDKERYEREMKVFKTTGAGAAPAAKLLSGGGAAKSSAVIEESDGDDDDEDEEDEDDDE